MNELLKVPDSAIIEDQKKIISKKSIEIGQLKSLVEEKNYDIKRLRTDVHNLTKHNKYLKNKIANYEKALGINKITSSH